MQIAEASVLD